MDYGLPSPGSVENWLFAQEELLISAIKRKARPRSQSTQGFSFLQGDALWIARFWQIYVHCPIEGDKPHLNLAMHHFHTLYKFSEETIKRCEAGEIAEGLAEKLRKQNYGKPSPQEYEDFARCIPPYHVRRKLREEFDPQTATGWKAGRG